MTIQNNLFKHSLKKYLSLLFITPVLCSCTDKLDQSISEPEIVAVDTQPNILMIVVDDMGFSDLGSFGGEIETPNLDQLAYTGVRFTNFQTAPTCSPTRAMLLTGTDNHQAGLGNMAEELAPNQTGQPGYEGILNNRVVTLAEILKDAGYHTYLTGKWHLGMTEETIPAARGFERSFAMLSGGASHYADMKPAYSPDPEAKAPYWKDTEQLKELPENFHYSTQFYVDELIQYFEEGKSSGKPFFSVLAFTAPHWPLQAPEKAIEKYHGKYDEGFEVLHQQRMDNLKSLGLFESDVGSANPPPKSKQWADLNPEQRAVETRQMEIYAAMIDQIDTHTGRLIEYLKSTGQYDNTLILFLSDNGAEGHDLDQTWPGDLFPDIRAVIDARHDFSFENMGKVNSYAFLGPGWAWASQPGLRLFKGATTEGGTRVAAFAHYPKEMASGKITNNLLSVKDIAPTILELVGVPHPSEMGRKDVAPISGQSMLDLLKNPTTVKSSERTLGMEIMGKRSLRQGDWKLVYLPEPYGIDDWQLYDLSVDLAETNDISAEHPERFEQMKKAWEQYAQENAVVLPDWVSGY